VREKEVRDVRDVRGRGKIESETDEMESGETHTQTQTVKNFFLSLF
jgi:hypothetical protein